MQRCASLKQSDPLASKCETINKEWQQQREIFLATRLRYMPSETWHRLTEEQRWTKSVVLAVFQANRRERIADDDGFDNFYIQLPWLLNETNFLTKAPISLIRDRDIFLARMNALDSRKYYIEQSERCHIQATEPALQASSAAVSIRKPYSRKGKTRWKRNNQSNSCSATELYNQTRPPLIVPLSLALDPFVWGYVVERHACLLLSPPGIVSSLSAFAQSIPHRVWNDAGFFEAVCTGIRDLVLNKCTAAARSTLRDWQMPQFVAVLAQIPVNVRNNVKRVQCILETWSMTEDTQCRLFEFARLLLETSPQSQQGTETTATLSQDKSFGLFVVNLAPTLSPDALTAFSPHLQNDVEFVTAVVTKNGLSIQHAPSNLRQDDGICRAACESDPHALYYCCLPKLREDPNLVSSYFLTLSNPNDHSVPLASTIGDIPLLDARAQWDQDLYNQLPPTTKGNKDVCFAALCTGYVVSISELPLCIQTDGDFWKRVLAEWPMAWFQLPTESTPLRHTIEMAQAFATIPFVEIAVDVFQRFPSLSSDSTVWLKIMEGAGSSYEFTDSNSRDAKLAEFHERWLRIMDLVPAVLWREKTFVVHAVARNEKVLGLLRDNENPLYEDRDVLAAALEHGVLEALCQVEARLQVLHPDLIASFIRKFEPYDVDFGDIYDFVADPLWSDTQVVCAWTLKSHYGMEFVHEVRVEDDPEWELMVAQLDAQLDGGVYRLHSAKLLADKEFLARLVQVCPLELRDLSAPGLAQDFDLAVIALGGPSTSSIRHNGYVRWDRDCLIGKYNLEDPGDFAFLTELAAHVRMQVASHDTFVKLVLGGMMATRSDVIAVCKKMSIEKTNLHASEKKDENWGSSPLTMLYQGGETSSVYKKLLVEFCGIPVGNELRVLRRASANLVQWGF